ncbi:DUF481 domain-containing protein [Candidatus Pacearchaeota archaeon]|nr:DUF481 domain-containing protein [Candidatus Pacearchaeota archaeon]
MVKLLITATVFILLTTSAFAGSIGISYTQKTKSDSSLNSYTKSIDFEDNIENIVDLAGSYNYGETGDLVTTDDGTFSVGYSPAVTERWHLWLREAVGYDKTIGIDFENIIGFGPKYVLYYNEETDTKLSLSAGILYHLISVDNVHSSDSRYSYRLKFTSKILQFIYYNQPIVGDSSDYISTIASSIKIASFDILSVKLFYKEKYRSIYRDTSTTEGMKIVLSF